MEWGVNMKIYFRYISYLLKSQLQYKASFIMTVITQFITPFALFAGIYFLFERFGSIKGWTRYEVFICYAVVVYMLQAAAAFWTIEALEVANIFTHGMKEHASYPLNIFPKWITIFFTFVIPFGTVNYLPMQYLLDKIDGFAWIYTFIPLVGALFILPCIGAWRMGVRKYSSAGS